MFVLNKKWPLRDISVLSYEGCPKKMRQGFCLLSQTRQPSIRFSNSFFLLKLRSIHKLLENHFSGSLGGGDIYNTKYGSVIDQFILSHSGLITSKFAPSSTNWPRTEPNSSQVEPSGPSNTN